MTEVRVQGAEVGGLRRAGAGVTYRAAGVDVAAADGWLARMRPLIRTTRRPGVLADRGQFAGLFRLSRGRWRDPVLVSSTDGVGTKLKVAQLVEPAGRRLRRGLSAHEVIGVDAVAMNVNDVLVYGAEPLFFLDYLAVGRLQPAVMSRLLSGIVRGCREAGCALLGGETAEMPGVYGPGEYEVAGFCVGVVGRRRLLDGSRVRAGDVVVGLASSGIHANGFSLVRRVLTRQQQVRLSRQLLMPTRIYVRPMLAALRAVPIHALVHVTGGGLARRLPGLVASYRGLRVRLIPGSWPVPPIFRTIQHAGGVSDAEMRRTFNMGIGMAAATSPRHAERVVQIVGRAGIAAWVIGTIERRRG